jgi:DnaJ like chaperone protein
MQGWYGKILGAFFGYLVGRGLLGAIVGLVIGHQFDRVTARNRTARELGRGPAPAQGGATGGAPGPGTGHGPGAEELRRVFFEATFQVMGHVAKSDGRVSEQEIDAARDAMARLQLGEADRRRAIEFYTDGKRADFPLEATLDRLGRLSGGQRDLSLLFVQIQLEAALRGNGLAERPRAVFQRICRALGISPIEFASLEAMLRLRGAAAGAGRAAGDRARAASELADAYEVLGVGSTASDDEVTLAYRRLMSQNHPDKLVAQGLPESMIAAAHERTQRILEAYETVKQHRGMK